VDLSATIIGVGAAIIVSIIGGYWALGRLVLAQFDKRLDERFTAIERARNEVSRLSEERFIRYEEAQRELDRRFLELTADLPTNYVRREDHIRFETVIYARLDALNSKFDLFLERQKRD